MFRKNKWQLRMGNLLNLADPIFQVPRDCKFYTTLGKPICSQGMITLGENTDGIRGFICLGMVRAHSEISATDRAYYIKARMPVMIRSSLTEWWKRVKGEYACGDEADIIQLICRDADIGLFIRKGFRFPAQTRKVEMTDASMYADPEWHIDSCATWVNDIMNLQIDAIHSHLEGTFGYYESLDARQSLSHGEPQIENDSGVRFEFRAFTSSTRSSPENLNVEAKGVTPHEFGVEAINYVHFANAMNAPTEVFKSYQFHSFLKTGQFRAAEKGAQMTASLSILNFKALKRISRRQRY